SRRRTSRLPTAPSSRSPTSAASTSPSRPTCCRARPATSTWSWTSPATSSNRPAIRKSPLSLEGGLFVFAAGLRRFPPEPPGRVEVDRAVRVVSAVGDEALADLRGIGIEGSGGRRVRHELLPFHDRLEVLVGLPNPVDLVVELHVPAGADDDHV